MDSFEDSKIVRKHSNGKVFWKKAGWLGMCLVPVAGAFIIQFLFIFILFFPLFAITIPDIVQQGIVDPVTISKTLMDTMLRLMMNSITELLFFTHVVITFLFTIWFYFGCSGRPAYRHEEGERSSKWVRVKKQLFLPGRIGRKGVLASIVAGLGLCLWANAFVSLSPDVFPNAYQRYVELMEVSGLVDNDAWAIIAAVLLAPLGEEFLCRGVVFHFAKKLTEGMRNRSLGFWIANTIQAFMFGLLHGNFIQGGFAFVIGLILGVMRERHNSMYPAIIGHFVVNFSSTFVFGYLWEVLPESALIYGILGALGILIIIWGLWIGKKAIFQQKSIPDPI